MNEIVPAFEVSLFEPTFSSAIDYIELGIDAIIENETIKGIPIVNTIVGIGKTVYNLRERNLLEQTLCFIKEFNKGKIETDKLEKYRNNIKKDSKKAEKELGRILIILDRTIEEIKTKMLAKAYKKYVFEEITWEQFCEITEAINRLFISDISLLYNIYDGQVTDTTQCLTYQADRLISLGLINSATKSMVISSSNINSKTEKHISINEFGKLFCLITK